MVWLQRELLLEHLLFLPSLFSLTPVCPLERKLQKDVEVKHDVLKEYGCPPDAVLLCQVNVKFYEEAVQDENCTQQYFKVRFDFEFGIEVDLAQKNDFQKMSCK